MRIEMTTPALLFTAISLLISAYTSRFLTLAGLLRQLDLQYKKDKDEIVLMQVNISVKAITLQLDKEGIK